MNVCKDLGANKEMVVFAENLLRELRPCIHPDHIASNARSLILEALEELKSEECICLSQVDSGKRKLRRLLKYKIMSGKLQEFVKFNKALTLRLQVLKSGRNGKKYDQWKNKVIQENCSKLNKIEIKVRTTTMYKRKDNQCNRSVKLGNYSKLKKFNTSIKTPSRYWNTISLRKQTIDKSTINSGEKKKNGDYKNKEVKANEISTNQETKDSKINKTNVHAGFSKIPRPVKTKINGSSSKIPIKRIINRNDFNQGIQKSSSKKLFANQNKPNSIKNKNVQDNKDILGERTLFYFNKDASRNKSSKTTKNINIHVNCNKDVPKHFLPTIYEMENDPRNEENEIINENLLIRKFKRYGEKSYNKVSNYSNVINLINNVCQPCIKSLKEDLVEIQNLLNEITYKYDKKLP